MAYYEGETLKHRIERGPLSVDEALDIATQVAQALARAHESGIVHRDIKPANLMLPKDGPVKIVDFGLAKLVGHSELTKTGTTVGTVAYMASGRTNFPRSEVIREVLGWLDRYLGPVQSSNR